MSSTYHEVGVEKRSYEQYHEVGDGDGEGEEEMRKVMYYQKLKFGGGASYGSLCTGL